MKCTICEQEASICEDCYTVALATAREILEERLNRIKELEAVMQKFVDKVESGRARSKETYAEFKQLLSK